MSSRLLTMKFMQRGTASSPSLEVPENVLEQPSSKRRRIGEESVHAMQPSERRVIEAAMTAEEDKRLRALELQAAQAGDTKWTMDYNTSSSARTSTTFDVITAGYNAIDSNTTIIQNADQDDLSQLPRSQLHGRKSFGNFGTAKKVIADDQEEGDDDTNNTSGSGSDNSESGRNSTRVDLGKRFKRVDITRTGGKIPKISSIAKRGGPMDVKLAKLNSISSGGGSKTHATSAGTICHECGRKGHIKAHCPVRHANGTRSSR